MRSKVNQGDIKLVIDQLNQVEGSDDDIPIISNAISILETLGNQLAQQKEYYEEIKELLK